MTAGSAYPNGHYWPETYGLSKREWYAGMALPAVLAGLADVQIEGPQEFAVKVAGICVGIGDAMVAELAKEPAP